MKFSSVILAMSALATTGIAAKTCTPSFDYCSDVLIKDKGQIPPGHLPSTFHHTDQPNRIYRGRSQGCLEGFRSGERGVEECAVPLQEPRRCWTPQALQQWLPRPQDGGQPLMLSVSVMPEDYLWPIANAEQMNHASMNYLELRRGFSLHHFTLDHYISNQSS